MLAMPSRKIFGEFWQRATRITLVSRISKALLSIHGHAM
jgi:hypothetical protein